MKKYMVRRSSELNTQDRTVAKTKPDKNLGSPGLDRTMTSVCDTGAAL